MFCQKCGAQNAEGVNFCISCGTSLAAPVTPPAYQQPVAPPAPPVLPQPQYVQPQYAQPQYAQPQYSQPPMAPVKKKKKTGLVIFLVLVVLAIAAVAVFALGIGGSAEKSTQGFLEAVFDFDYAKAEKYSFIDIEKYYEIEEYKDASNLKEEFKNAKADSYAELEEEFGDNAKITVEVTGTKELNEADAAAALAGFEDEKDYFKNDGAIKEVVEVSVTISVKGDTKEDTQTTEMIAVKSGSKWYVMEGLEMISEFLSY